MYFSEKGVFLSVSGLISKKQGSTNSPIIFLKKYKKCKKNVKKYQKNKKKGSLNK